MKFSQTVNCLHCRCGYEYETFKILFFNIGLVARKPVFGIYDKIICKLLLAPGGYSDIFIIHVRRLWPFLGLKILN